MSYEGELAVAAEARLQGDFSTAISICQKILASGTSYSDAKSLLGVCMIETGQVDAGAPLVIEALSEAPDNWRYLLNASVLNEATGDLSAALTTAKKAAEAAPDRFEVWGRLGNLLAMAGDFRAAADTLQRALSLKPDHEGVAFQLAAAKLETQDLAGAKAAVEAIKESSPFWFPSLRMRTHIGRQLSDWEMMVEAAEQWLNLATDDDPMKDEARMALSFGLNKQGYYDRAAKIYKPLADNKPPDVDHLNTIARLLLSARDMPGAYEYYQKALETDPNDSGAHLGTSRYKTFLGKLEEAESHCRRAIELNPRSADAYAQLSEITRGVFSDEELFALEQIIEDEALELDQRAVAAYAAGDGHHKRKDRDKAFAAWRRANQLKAQHLALDEQATYTPTNQEAATSYLTNFFHSPARPEFMFKPSEANPVPIFIVGMPRSGTTLLESALSAHPDVAGAGELPALPIIMDDFLEWAEDTGWREGPLPPADVAAWRERYFRQYEDYKIGPAKYVVDKLPQNFQTVGLIRLLFPEAKIIHIRRNPMETGFSIFRRNFTRHWTFSTSLENIGHYYGQYAKLMQHWHKVFPHDIKFIQYEDLVPNFEQEIRDILAFCDIEWNDNCLEFYRAERAVITFSAVQVRKPPSVDHLNSSGPYAEYLQLLANSLAQGGVHLTTGAIVSGP